MSGRENAASSLTPSRSAGRVVGDSRGSNRSGQGQNLLPVIKAQEQQTMCLADSFFSSWRTGKWEALGVSQAGSVQASGE